LVTKTTNESKLDPATAQFHQEKIEFHSFLVLNTLEIINTNKKKNIMEYDPITLSGEDQKLCALSKLISPLRIQVAKKTKNDRISLLFLGK
jgi:hypothetical protein